MTKKVARYTLPDEHILEIYEPQSSGIEAMSRGRCPECNGQLYGYVGRYGAIRELDGDGLVVGHSPYASSYGHLRCVEQRFDDLVKILTAPSTVPYGLDWNRGTQRDMIKFLQAQAHSVVEVCFDPSASRYAHYEFRVREIS